MFKSRQLISSASKHFKDGIYSFKRFSSTIQAMEKDGIVPDVISAAPKGKFKFITCQNIWTLIRQNFTLFSALVKVSYPSGVSVNLGNILKPRQVKDTPTVQYDAESNSFYTLCMTDPDAPSRQDPQYREWHHWLVGNIPGADVAKGETLSAYIGSGPPEGEFKVP